MFAATPPAEALKTIVPWAASWNKRDEEQRAVMACDISRAFFHAEARPDIYVELPEEDQVPGQYPVGEVEISIVRDNRSSCSMAEGSIKAPDTDRFQAGNL